MVEYVKGLLKSGVKLLSGGQDEEEKERMIVERLGIGKIRENLKRAEKRKKEVEVVKKFRMIEEVKVAKYEKYVKVEDEEDLK